MYSRHAMRIDYLCLCVDTSIRTRYQCTDEEWDFLEEIIRLFRQIKSNEFGVRTFWTAVRFETKQELIDTIRDFESVTEDELSDLVTLWENSGTRKQKWYRIQIREDNGICMISINQTGLVLSKEETMEGTLKVSDAVKELLEWIHEVVCDTIDRLKKGSYNENSQKNLSYEHRFGILKRSDYDRIYPSSESGLSDGEKREFLRFAMKDQEKSEEEFWIPDLSASQFYTYCSLGYQENRYPGLQGLTPKEQYYIRADGRDDGLGEIEEDSQDAFRYWFRHRYRFGHPWEVCRGGNWTHISLSVAEDGEGFILYLSGESEMRWVETVRFYLALRRNEIPVVLLDLELLMARVEGTERMGVVPRCFDVKLEYQFTVFYPNEKLDSYIYLPFEEEEKKMMIKLAKWMPIKEVELSNDDEDV